MASLFATSVISGTAAAAGAATPVVAAAAPAAISWGAVAATTAIVGGIGLGAYGMLQAGQAGAQDVFAQQAGLQGQQQVAMRQKAIADYNARVAEQEAKAIEQSTRFRQRRHAEEASRYGSSLLAGLGASGAVVSEGAPLMIQARQAAEAELDSLMIGYEGQTRAARARSQARLDIMEGLVHRQQADIYGVQARRLGRRATSVSRAGQIGAGATLLTGFGSLASMGFN